MLFQNLRHEAIQGAAGRRDELEHIAAFRFCLEGPRDRLELPANAGHAL